MNAMLIYKDGNKLTLPTQLGEEAIVLSTDPDDEIANLVAVKNDGDMTDWEQTNNGGYTGVRQDIVYPDTRPLKVNFNDTEDFSIVMCFENITEDPLGVNRATIIGNNELQNASAENYIRFVLLSETTGYLIYAGRRMQWDASDGIVFGKGRRYVVTLIGDSVSLKMYVDGVFKWEVLKGTNNTYKDTHYYMFGARNSTLDIVGLIEYFSFYKYALGKDTYLKMINGGKPWEYQLDRGRCAPYKRWLIGSNIEELKEDFILNESKFSYQFIDGVLEITSLFSQSSGWSSSALTPKDIASYAGCYIQWKFNMINNQLVGLSGLEEINAVEYIFEGTHSILYEDSKIGLRRTYGIGLFFGGAVAVGDKMELSHFALHTNVCTHQYLPSGIQKTKWAGYPTDIPLISNDSAILARPTTQKNYKMHEISNQAPTSPPIAYDQQFDGAGARYTPVQTSTGIQWKQKTT